MIKLIGLIKKVTDTGLLKPLPLSGLGKELIKAKGEKDKLKGYGRFIGYVAGGLLVWGLIAKGVAPEKVILILEALGF